MNFLTLNTAASGLFSPTPVFNFTGTGESRLADVYNPGVFEYQRGSYSLINDTAKVFKWLSTSTGDTKWKIDSGHIDSYADATVKLASDLIVARQTAGSHLSEGQPGPACL